LLGSANGPAGSFGPVPPVGPLAHENDIRFLLSKEPLDGDPEESLMLKLKVIFN
jgi:hypothetical protein